MVLEMQVMGFSDLYVIFFNSIVRVFSENSFKTLLKLSILMAGFTVLTSLVVKKDIISVIKWFFYFYILIYVAFVPKVTLEIADRLTLKGMPVAHVPLGLAIAASLSSNLSVKLTTMMEKNFTMPDDNLVYSKYGMVFSAQVLKALTQFEITDPIVDSNMKSFIERCVFYDIWFKKYTLQDIVTSSDIWTFLKAQKMSPIRGIFYLEKGGERKFLTCAETRPKLEEDWQKALSNGKLFYGQRLFSKQTKSGNNTEDNDPIKILNDYLPISYGFFTKIAEQKADALMKQAMMANAIERGALSYGAKVNADAMVKSFSYARAQSQKRLTNQTVGEMACYWLPLIKVTLELILYGSFIFVILISIFPFGQRTLKGYLATLLWVQLWPPVFAIFHLIVSYYGQGQISSVLSEGMTMQKMSSLNQLTNDMVGLAGYMSMSVPALTAFILWGSHHYLGQISQYVGGVVQSASSQASTELASGNISLGNTNFGNHSAFNTSSNKFDTNMRVAGGSSSYQLADGSILSHQLGGRDTLNMQGSMSSLPVNFDSARSYRSSLMKAAEHSENTGMNKMHTYSHNLTAAARDVNQLSHYANQMEANGESYSQQKSSGMSHAFSVIDKVNDEVSKRTGLSRQESEALTASLYAEAKGHVGFGIPIPKTILNASVGGSLGSSRTSSTSDANTFNNARGEAKSIMDAHSYNENMDYVTRAIQDKSFRTQDEKGGRLVGDISSSLDRSDSSRHDASLNFQKADFFRKTANFSDEKSASIRNNLNQEFVEFLSNQHDINGSKIGIANVNEILNSEKTREKYAQAFMQHQVHRVEGNWQHGLPKSNKGIENIYHHNQKEIADDRHINAINLSNNHLQSLKAERENLNINDKTDHQVKDEVLALNNKNENSIQDKKEMVHQEKSELAYENKTIMDNYHRGGIISNQLGVKDFEKGKK